MKNYDKTLRAAVRSQLFSCSACRWCWATCSSSSMRWRTPSSSAASCGVSALASVGATGFRTPSDFGFHIGVCTALRFLHCTAVLAQGITVSAPPCGQSPRALHCRQCGATISTVALTRPMMQRCRHPTTLADGAVIHRAGFLWASRSSFVQHGGGHHAHWASSKTPLYFLDPTSALTIGLDLCSSSLFQMGVLGAALATDILQVISAC